MARTFHARTREGRDGFAWPINGERNRQRSLDDARRALRYVLNGPGDPCCGLCGLNWRTCRCGEPADPVASTPPCDCLCHTTPGVMHVAACCQTGLTAQQNGSEQ